jgi:hypothetical protein
MNSDRKGWVWRMNWVEMGKAMMYSALLSFSLVVKRPIFRTTSQEVKTGMVTGNGWWLRDRLKFSNCIVLAK